MIHSEWVSSSKLLEWENPLKQKIKRFDMNYEHQLQLKMLNSNLMFAKDWVDEQPQAPSKEPNKSGYRNDELAQFLKRTFLNNELQYINFDRNTLKVDRVVSCSEMFDIIHPKKAGKIMSKWSDSIVKVVQILINFRYEQVPKLTADQLRSSLPEHFEGVGHVQRNFGPAGFFDYFEPVVFGLLQNL